jgi:hypothetical protein
MSVLGTSGICWLGLNAAVFAALATRKSRPGLRARLFNWVIRNERASFSRTVAFARSSALHRGTPRSIGSSRLKRNGRRTSLPDSRKPAG